MAATQRAVTTITEGVAGAGKSYARVRFVVDEFLPLEGGKLITNLPLNVDAIAAHVAGKIGCEPDAIRERIVPISPETEAKWRDEKETPLDTFEGWDLDGAHIIIDEAHTICGRHSKADTRKAMASFCGELRHRGATIEFMTQDQTKLAAEVVREAGMTLSVTNAETERDPICKIPLSYWYELRAGLITGEYTAAVWQRELRKRAGKLVINDERKWKLEPEYFAFYDSYATPKEGGKAGTAKVREFERRSKAGLVLWFCLRNLDQLFWRAAVLGLVVWLMCGGGGVLTRHFLAHWSRMGAANGVGKVDKVKAATVAPQVKNGKDERAAVLAENRDLERWKKRAGDLEVALYREKNEAKNLLESKLAMQREFVYMRNLLDEAGKLASIQPDRIVFHDGTEYVERETIREGLYRGRKIQKIDFAKRCVYLDSGDVLRLASSQRLQAQRELDAKERAAGRSALAAKSGGATPANEPTPDGQYAEWQAVPQRSRNGTGGFPADGREGIRSVDRLGGESGYEARESGRGPSAGGRTARDGGSAAASGSNPRR